MTKEEIISAIDNGKKVHWLEDFFEVVKENGQYVIKNLNSGHCVSLLFDGTLYGEENDFYLSQKQMKIIEENGFKYSLNSFEGYTHRAKVKIGIVGGTRFLDIYTTDKDVNSIENFLLNRKSDNVTWLSIYNLSTIEEDLASAELIDEILKIY